MVSASFAKGTNAFSPWRMYSSFCSRAVVCKSLGSKSKVYSISAAVNGLHAPSLIPGKYVCFCSSLPAMRIGVANRLGVSTPSVPAKSPKAISSIASTPVTALRSPKPPYTSGTEACNRPSSQPLFKIFFFSSLLSSASCAAVRKSLIANFPTASISICCSSVGSNEYILSLFRKYFSIRDIMQTSISCRQTLLDFIGVGHFDHAVFIKIFDICTCLFNDEQLVVSTCFTIDRG